MGKTGVFGFREGEVVRLESGAIITPILRRGGRGSLSLTDYLYDARNGNCEWQSICNIAVMKISYCVGFSCQQCPLNA